MIPQLFFVADAIGLETNADHDFFAVIIVRNSHGGRIEHGRVLVNRIIDFPGGNIFTPLDDEFLEPAGDQRGLSSRVPGLLVRFATAPPSGSMTKTSQSPSWSEEKAIFVPSGDQLGKWSSQSGLWVRFVRYDPLKSVT